MKCLFVFNNMFVFHQKSREILRLWNRTSLDLCRTHSRRPSSLRTTENRATSRSPPRTSSTPKPWGRSFMRSPPRTQTRPRPRPPLQPRPHRLFRATPPSPSSSMTACPERSRSKTTSPSSPPARGSSRLRPPRPPSQPRLLR